MKMCQLGHILFNDDPRKLIDYLKAKGWLCHSRTATIFTLVVQEFLCNGLGKQQEETVLFSADRCVVKPSP